MRAKQSRVIKFDTSKIYLTPPHLIYITDRSKAFWCCHWFAYGVAFGVVYGFYVAFLCSALWLLDVGLLFRVLSCSLSYCYI